MRYAKVPASSGHVFRARGVRGAIWYAKYRLPGGRQRERRSADIVYDGTGVGTCFGRNVFATEFPVAVTAAFPCGGGA